MDDKDRSKTTRQVGLLKTTADIIARQWQKMRDESPPIVATFGYSPKDPTKFVYETAIVLAGLVMPLSHSDGTKEFRYSKPIVIRNERTGIVEREFTLPIQDLIIDKVFNDCFDEGFTILVASQNDKERIKRYGEYWADHGDRIIAKIERGDYDKDK